MIFFSLVFNKKHHWIFFVFFPIAIFSSPMVVEYARYTGLITHLISGCLSLLAVIFLRQAFFHKKTRLAWQAVICLLLSVLAKEDFLVFYGFAYFYFMATTESSIKIRWIGFLGGFTAVLIIVGMKLFSATQFLGVLNSNSSYFLDKSPVSILKTMIIYLSGSNHPAMLIHGIMVVTCTIGSLLLGLLGVVIQRKFGLRVLFFLGCAFSIMFPYSLLPNHVNAYYEYLWLPFILFSAYSAVDGVAGSFFGPDRWLPVANWIAPIALVAGVVLVAHFDYPGRKSVAAWYDQRASQNRAVLSKISEQSANSMPSDTICVVGANAFSPWYMHDGRYLVDVMRLKNRWIIYQPDASAYIAGFQSGALSSNGRFTVESIKNVISDHCGRLIDLRPFDNG